MTNEEFQKVVLAKFEENEKVQKEVLQKLGALEKGQTALEKGQTALEKGQTALENRQTALENRQTALENRQISLENRQISLENGQQGLKDDIAYIKTRQDEIYQVVRAIEHSNIVGKSELDSHNIRIAKVEGKLKKAAKVFNQDTEVDKASNL